MPPMPPPGQEGRGSYVWVPDPNLEDDHDDPAAQEQHDAQEFVEDIAEQDHHGSQAEEEYIDPYAADVAEFPDGGDGGEQGNSAGEEEVGDADDVGQNTRVF